MFTFTQEQKMKNKTFPAGFVAGISAIALSVASQASVAQDTIRIGGLSMLDGASVEVGQDGMRGIKMALAEFHYTVAGKKIEFLQAGSDGNPDNAVAKTRELIEQYKVDIMIGPLSGNEGLAIKEYAKTQPNKTFVNGASASQDTTLRDPASNFFRFSTDGAQWMAGLGKYAYDTKKYRKIAAIAEDYSFPYTQVFGFMHEFCGRGGHVVQKLWVPLGEQDYSKVIYTIPKDVDAIFVALGGRDALNFLTQYYGAGFNKPIIGSSALTDQTVLSSNAKFSKRIIGIPSGTPVAESNPSALWKNFVANYKKSFPDGFNSPSLFAYMYYIETKAVLLALQKVNGDLSGGQKRFQTVLAKLSFESPTGKVSLDENRQAIADVFITEVAQDKDGKLYNKVVKIIPQVRQTLGMPREAFLKLGKVGRDNPECP